MLATPNNNNKANLRTLRINARGQKWHSPGNFKKIVKLIDETIIGLCYNGKIIIGLSNNDKTIIGQSNNGFTG